MTNPKLSVAFLAIFLLFFSCSKKNEDKLASTGYSKAELSAPSPISVQSSASGNTQLVQMIQTIMMDKFGFEDASSLTPEANFFFDLNLDDLDFFELILLIEEEFGMQIPDEDSEIIYTIGDLAEYLQAHIPTVVGTGGGDDGDGGGGGGIFPGGTGPGGTGGDGGGTGGGGTGGGGTGGGGTSQPGAYVINEMDVSAESTFDMGDDSFEGPTTLDSAGVYEPSASTAFTPPTVWGRAAKLRYKHYTQSGIKEMVEIKDLRMFPIPIVSTRTDNYGRLVIRRAKAIDRLSSSVIHSGGQTGMIFWDYILQYEYTCPKVPGYYKQTQRIERFNEKVNPYSPVFN